MKKTALVIMALTVGAFGFISPAPAHAATCGGGEICWWQGSNYVGNGAIWPFPLENNFCAPLSVPARSVINNSSKQLTFTNQPCGSPGSNVTVYPGTQVSNLGFDAGWAYRCLSCR
jgi:hypothetical protein